MIVSHGVAYLDHWLNIASLLTVREQIGQIETRPWAMEYTSGRMIHGLNRDPTHMSDKQYRKLAITELDELQIWTIVLEPLE